MVQIVTNILPHLSSHARPESELKSSFVILLGESVAEVVWALRVLRDERAEDEALPRVPQVCARLRPPLRLAQQLCRTL